ncbi:melatonin receptor type 1A-like [Actinia tenebrosa]|uniref:Melatonin receptor type 1A-like n=1 Tax=Actinia tenebrosa TaxID=6105 RepID=A0A6P8J5L2_ACTTE|nr:melatonin receptor type 1A-like [Actinia tenebrosa]
MSHIPDLNSSTYVSLRTRKQELIIIETFIYAFIASAAAFGNSLVLWVVYKNPTLRSIPNYFVVSLAFSDIGMALLGTPWSIGTLATGNWPFSFVACQFQGYVVIWLAVASLLNLMIMAFNRYCRIVNTSWYRRIFTARRTRILIFSAYAIASLGPLPYVVGGNIFVFQPGKFFCYQKSLLEFTMPLMLIFIAIPTVTIIICYLKVFLALRKHRKNLFKPNTDLAQTHCPRITVENIRITKTLFSTVVGYLLCWMPVLVVEFIDLAIGFGKENLPRQVYVMFTMCGLSSSAINPIIYGVMNKNFAREYRRVFGCVARSNDTNKVNPIRIAPQRKVQDNTTL